jgi:hypothetical protein
MLYVERWDATMTFFLKYFAMWYIIMELAELYLLLSAMLQI